MDEIVKALKSMRLGGSARGRLRNALIADSDDFAPIMGGGRFQMQTEDQDPESDCSKRQSESGRFASNHKRCVISPLPHISSGAKVAGGGKRPQRLGLEIDLGRTHLYYQSASSCSRRALQTPVLQMQEGVQRWLHLPESRAQIFSAVCYLLWGNVLERCPYHN
ncbi:hypothetical protein MSG28_000562 [Choristoneura fumiferana]|uniref:Uncharacterized protein n=1 Tax=Choristoneura fumiferana TaxID=7141 RepID=A0ACC0K1E9_CHOFU|nr:hypothetical protein MSG28_000562 [Choristoneura fumiferana]